MARVVAALATLLAVLAPPPAAAQSAPTATCPATASTANITCTDGFTWSGASQLSSSYMSTAGECACRCEPCLQDCASSSSSDYSNNPDVMLAVFAVSSQASCTAAACTAKYPTFCATVPNNGAHFTSIATRLANNTPTVVASGVGAVCMKGTIACNASAVSNPCGLPEFTTGSLTFYSSYPGPTAVSDCAEWLQYNPSITGLVVCSTNNCNAPASGTPLLEAQPFS